MHGGGFVTRLATLGRSSRRGVALWDDDRRRVELPILRRPWPPGSCALYFPGDGVPGPLPQAGQTWTLRSWAAYGKRPIRGRVLSVEGDLVRIYVGTRRWYDSAPGTLRLRITQLRRGWYFGRDPNVIQLAPLRNGAQAS